MFVWVVVGVFVLLLASFVVGSLSRPAVPTGTVTPPHPAALGDTLVGPVVFTIDATAPARWSFFDFSRNSAVTDPGPLDWDLAMKRFEIIVNGGPAFAGRGGIADLGVVPFDSVAGLPDTGYVTTAPDSTNAVIRRWYKYGYTTHLLQPKGHVYAVRTADGKYAKVEIVSYYCGEVQGGCFTLRYVYQGDGSRNVALRGP